MQLTQEVQENRLYVYENLRKDYYSDVNLVFQRFNFFLISSAFLFAAFFTTSRVAPFSIILAAMGLIFAIFFMGLNYVNVRFIHNRTKISDLIIGIDTGCDIKIALDGNMSQFDLTRLTLQTLREIDRPEVWLKDLPNQIGCLIQICSHVFTKDWLNALAEYNRKLPISYLWALPCVFVFIWAGLLSLALYFAFNNPLWIILAIVFVAWIVYNLHSQGASLYRDCIKPPKI